MTILVWQENVQNIDFLTRSDTGPMLWIENTGTTTQPARWVLTWISSPE